MMNKKLLLLFVFANSPIIFAGEDGRTTKACEIVKETARRQEAAEKKAADVIRKMNLCVNYHFKYNAITNTYSYKRHHDETALYLANTNTFVIQRKLWNKENNAFEIVNSETDFDTFIIQLETASQ